MDAKEALSMLWTPEQQAEQQDALADSSSEPASLSEDPALDAAVRLLPSQDENLVWLSVELTPLSQRKLGPVWASEMA
jgi:hypothetical protein